MSRWRITYKGRSDSVSAAGVAQPSWHVFDKRVWELGDFSITLTNLRNIGVHAPKKIATYLVVLSRNGVEVSRAQGHDWKRLVREAKMGAA